VAVTGARGLLGSRLIARLAAAGWTDRLLALDLRPSGGVPHRQVDLAAPGVDRVLLELLKTEGIEAVVHLALPSEPGRDRARRQRLESQGTLALLSACSAAGVKHVVMRSYTALYGAHPDNPELIDEDQPLRADPGLAWASHKIEAEQHAAAFARRHPEMTVSVLRFAPILGRGVQGFYPRLLERQRVLLPAGGDPQLQLLHPDDALDALERCLERRPPGPLNVAPSATVPLRRALELCDRPVLDVPAGLLRLSAALAWGVGLGGSPGGFVDYVRYSCVADGRRARRVLGFDPRYRSREALASWLAERRGARRQLSPPRGRPAR
jgi:UDP-glucose 4-epimerase